MACGCAAVDRRPLSHILVARPDGRHVRRLGFRLLGRLRLPAGTLAPHRHRCCSLAGGGSCLTHPCGVLYAGGLVILMVLHDRSRIGWRHLLGAGAAYLVGLALWGIYILQDPVSFYRQFTGNVSGIAGEFTTSTRWSGLLSPLTALKREYFLRYGVHVRPVRKRTLAEPVSVAGAVGVHARSSWGCDDAFPAKARRLPHASGAGHIHLLHAGVVRWTEVQLVPPAHTPLLRSTVGSHRPASGIDGKRNPPALRGRRSGCSGRPPASGRRARRPASTGAMGLCISRRVFAAPCPAVRDGFWSRRIGLRSGLRFESRGRCPAGVSHRTKAGLHRHELALSRLVRKVCRPQSRGTHPYRANADVPLRDGFPERQLLNLPAFGRPACRPGRSARPRCP